METVSLGSQVQELHDSAEQVEAEIKGFHSDIGKKTFSLKTVWDKFIQRVENRGVVLHMALTFHTDIQQVSGDKGQGSKFILLLSFCPRLRCLVLTWNQPYLQRLLLVGVGQLTWTTWSILKTSLTSCAGFACRTGGS